MQGPGAHRQEPQSGDRTGVILPSLDTRLLRPRQLLRPSLESCRDQVTALPHGSVPGWPPLSPHSKELLASVPSRPSCEALTSSEDSSRL